MNPALTATTWQRTLDRYKNTSAMARVLSEIIDESDDPKVAAILDRYALTFMEAS